MIQKVAKVVSGDIFKRGAGMNNESLLGPRVMWGKTPRRFAFTNVNLPFYDLAITGHHLNVLAQKVAIKGAVESDVQRI